MTATTFDAFSDAQARLDEGTPRPGDRELTAAYDVQVLQPAAADYARQQDEAEFDRRFPEPPNHTVITWEDADRVRHAAYREDTTPDAGDWWLFGSGTAHSWYWLVVERDLRMDDLTVLVPDGDLPAAYGTAAPVVFEQLVADDCTVLPAPLPPSEFTDIWPAEVAS